MWKNLYTVKKVIKVKSNKTNKFTVKLSDYLSQKEILETTREIYAVPLNIDLNSMSMGYEITTNVLNKDTIHETYEVKLSENTIISKLKTVFDENYDGRAGEVGRTREYNVSLPVGTISMFIEANFTSKGSVTILFDNNTLYTGSGRYFGDYYNSGVKYIDNTIPHNIKFKINNTHYYEFSVYSQNRGMTVNLDSEIEIFIFVLGKTV